MRQAIIAITGAGLLYLSSCAAQSVGYKIDYLKGRGLYPPQTYVQVFDHKPTLWSYVPIARIKLNGSADLTSAQELAALEQKAKSIGANAVIVTHEAQIEQSEIQYNPAGGQYTMKPLNENEQISVLAIHMSKKIQ